MDTAVIFAMGNLLSKAYNTGLASNSSSHESLKKDDGSPVEPHDTATTKVVDAKVDDDTVPSDPANVDELKSDPAVPTWIDYLEQQNIPGAYPVTPGESL